MVKFENYNFQLFYENASTIKKTIISELKQYFTDNITSDLHFSPKPTVSHNLVCFCISSGLIFCVNIEKEIIFFV